MRSRCTTRCRPGRIGATAGICATCCWAGAAGSAHTRPTMPTSSPRTRPVAPPGYTCAPSPSTPAALLAALKAGHYYASTGPELHEIRLHDGQLTVHCSPARKVLLTGCVPGAEVIQGEALTQCSLPLTLFKARGYCRVTVEDAAGGRAWSNPIQLRPPGST